MTQEKEFLGIDYLNKTRNNLNDFMFGKSDNKTTQTNNQKEFFPITEKLQTIHDFLNEYQEETIDFSEITDCFKYGYNGNIVLTSEQEKQAINVINGFFDRFRNDYEEMPSLSTKKEILDTIFFVEGFSLLWNKINELDCVNVENAIKKLEKAVK